MAFDLSSQPRFGRAGGPTVAHVRENLAASATVSSILSTIPSTTNIEWLPSPGVGSQYLIWGVQAGTSAATLFGWKLMSSGGTDLCIACCTKQGPFFQSFSQPIAVGENQGLGFYSFVAPSGTNLVCVHITTVEIRK